MKNNKGYASSFILFGLLVLFLLVISILMVTINNTSSLSGKLKKNVADEIETAEIYKKYNFYSNGDIQEFIVPKTGNYTVKAWAKKDDNSNDTVYINANIDLNNGDKLYIIIGNKNGFNSGMSEIRTVGGDLSSQESINSRILLAALTKADSSVSPSFKDIVIKEGNEIANDEKSPTTNGYIQIGYTLSAKNLYFDDSVVESNCDNVQCILEKVYSLTH